MTLMPTYEALTDEQRGQVTRMTAAARSELREYCKPLHDDHRAIFDEACAVYLLASLNADTKV